MIQRKEYLNQLIEWKDKNLIKVVTGVRRCGKSTLFLLYLNYLKSVGVEDEQIISINLEDLDYEHLTNYRELYKYVNSKLCKDKMTYIFIDEVQNCKGFEKAIDSLFIKENVDIYITGSNAYMLSGELATLLSGRYITIDMLPLSFKEYYSVAKDSNKDKMDIFNDYLQFGSFPYIYTLNRNDMIISQYLEGIYNTILIKDIAQREGIADVTLLEKIIKFVCSSIGSPISLKKITDTLISNGRKVSINTVDHYMNALCDSYIFYKVDRYDIRGKQHLKTLGKYYVVDTGIRNLLLSNSTSDIGHMIENVVYLELLRRGNKVNIGKLAEKEVDFVTKKNNQVNYYQVSATVLDPVTLKRELEPFELIKDNYPKILLTLDVVGKGMSYDGVQQINLIDWLLSE